MSDAFSEYDYVLPSELVASVPAEPRDSARLFVYDTASDTITFDTFANLSAHVPARALLVLNDTRVVPARVTLRKPSGGNVGVLLLLNEWDGEGPVPALLKGGVRISSVLSFLSGETCTVVRRDGPVYFLLPNISKERLYSILNTDGETPIPPYIKNTPLTESELRARYQTVFAREGNSIAAPTASMHFTDAVFESLEKKGVAPVHISLHVGYGTFAPVTAEALLRGTLHSEPVRIGDDAAAEIAQIKKTGRSVIAAGTTVVRGLESFADELMQGKGGEKHTTLFIRPPYQFRIVDSLVTNFHVPRSSLIGLVDAFLKHKSSRRGIIELYEIAIRGKFRFFSFGDAMYIR